MGDGSSSTIVSMRVRRESGPVIEAMEQIFVYCSGHFRDFNRKGGYLYMIFEKF